MTGAVLVTGATGTVGSAVLRHLLRLGEPVLAASRDGADTGGAPGRALDLADRSGWAAALAGIDRLFLMRPPAMADVASTLIPFVDAAIAGGLRHTVFLSVQGAQVNRAAPHHAVERHLRRRRAPSTMLRPNFFMQNLSTVYADEIRTTGRVVLPAGRARTACIDTEDIGEVAARILAAPERFRATALTLSGEEALDYGAVARILTGVLGRPIEYTRPTPAAYEAHLRAAGRSEDYVAVQRMLYRIVRLRFSSLPNRSVRRVLGRPATTFRAFAERERAAWT